MAKVIKIKRDVRYSFETKADPIQRIVVSADDNGNWLLYIDGELVEQGNFKPRAHSWAAAMELIENYLDRKQIATKLQIAVAEQAEANGVPLRDGCKAAPIRGGYVITL